MRQRVLSVARGDEAAGRIAPPDEPAYAASKHAIVGLASALPLEVEDAGVHVLTRQPPYKPSASR
jgi:NAD(P)-dependent dehydrogenase (short-subunit alcohol dehydrogenase family)